MTAGLPRSRTRRDRKHSLPMRPSCRSAGLFHDGWIGPGKL